MENRREEARARTLKGAKAVFNDGNSVVDCVIRDLSEGGARLKVETAIGFPDHFTLVMESQRARRNCRVIWRSANEIGVTFE